MSIHPTISILIPVFNRRTLLQKTLESLQAQFFFDWECLIIDDGSTEDIETFVAEFASNDSRFVYLENKRKKGAPGARNTGLLAARGEFIYFFDSDNLMHADLLQKMHDEMQRSEADVCNCYARVVDENGTQISAFQWNCFGNIQEALIAGKTYVDYNISLIRKSALTTFGLTDEDCPSYQEWDTHLRLSEYCQYTTVQEMLVDYRKGETDTISSDANRSAAGYLYNLKKHRALFTNYPDHFTAQGITLLTTVEAFGDVEFSTQIRNELRALIPDFERTWENRRKTGSHDSLSVRLKTFVKRILKR